MATSQQVRWDQVQPILAQQPTEQVAFAQFVVNIGSVRGGVINLGTPGERAADLIRARPQPPHILPRRVSGLVDRDQEQRVAGQALARDQVVDVYGPDGMGKTSLISQIMHTQIPGAFPDGMVYLSGRHQGRDDLLQQLVECFYQAPGGHVKVSENEARRYLAGKRALIALDDCNNLAKGDAEALSQAAPQSALIIAGRARQAWNGTRVALGGLPRIAALALLERLWGQPLGEARQVADTICAALGDVPLAIVQAVETAAERQVPLDQLLREVQPPAASTPGEPDPIGQSFLMLGRHLSDGERATLSAIAAPGGDSVDRQAIVAISGLPTADVERYLARLVRLELVQVEGERYKVEEGLRPYARRLGADAAMIARAAEHYVRLAGSLRAHSPDPDEENVIWALRYYAQQQQWRQVIDAVRSMEPYLATSGRWGQWRRRLHYALHAAQQIGDRATEAWAQNQLGVIALGAADTAAARQLFQGALRLWRELGDQQGMTVARWNLQMLLGPPPPPPRRGESGPSPGGGLNPVVAALGVVAVVVVLALGALAVVLLNRGGGVTPLPPAITQVPPRRTTVVPPLQARVDLTLLQGCDQAYAPGDALDLRVESNVAGVVDVFWRAPNGERQRQFRRDVAPGQPAVSSAKAPPRPGRWVLEAILDDGRAVDECALTVADRVEPAVRVWLGGGCEGTYQPGAPEQVSYQSSVDGELAVYLVDDQGQASLLFSDRVAAGQSMSRPWQLPADEGNWVLRAELTGGAASGDCRFSILSRLTVVYDFVASAARAAWSAQMLTARSTSRAYPIEFPGDASPRGGFALWYDRPPLEDGSRAPGTVLVTAPVAAASGMVWGDYDLAAQPIYIQAGDVFSAQVGLLRGEETGEVTFELYFEPRSVIGRGYPSTIHTAQLRQPGMTLLGSINDAYDQQVRDWTIPLDSIAGQAGLFRLLVRAGDDAHMHRAAWVVARIERYGE